MSTQQDIDRINALARKSKTPEGLAGAERRERAALRRRCIHSVKASLTPTWTTPGWWTGRARDQVGQKGRMRAQRRFLSQIRLAFRQNMG